MSLSVDGFWKAGFWSQTFWADGFWHEGALTSVALDIDPRYIAREQARSFTTAAPEARFLVADSRRIFRAGS